MHLVSFTKKINLTGILGWVNVDHLIPGAFLPGSTCLVGQSLLLGTQGAPKGECQGNQEFFYDSNV